MVKMQILHKGLTFVEKAAITISWMVSWSKIQTTQKV